LSVISDRREFRNPNRCNHSEAARVEKCCGALEAQGGIGRWVLFPSHALYAEVGRYGSRWKKIRTRGRAPTTSGSTISNGRRRIESQRPGREYSLKPIVRLLELGKRTNKQAQVCDGPHAAAALLTTMRSPPPLLIRRTAKDMVTDFQVFTLIVQLAWFVLFSL
jgi:hypothetical protein